jgi:L-lactate dehydrogenase complex protein LldF
MNITPTLFKKNAVANLQNEQLRRNLKKATSHSLTKRAEAVHEIANEWESLRERAHHIKKEAIDHLSDYLEQFERTAMANGIKVVWASDAKEACEAILHIIKQHNALRVVKSKSLVTEEIELNHALEHNGIKTVETDLGEYIVQLAGEPPSHITAPALHKSREEIGKLFAEKLHIPYSSEPTELTAAARKLLREEFLGAEIGISGVNFAIAETGTLVIVENEGNGRMTTTLPKVHIAVTGIEKIIPKFEDLEVFLRLLARSATGQKLTTYTIIINSPRQPEEMDGPEEVYLILLDNGRTDFLSQPKLREALYCIRCGACMNVCPVYQKVGGHTYGWVYPGPIGSVLTPVYRGTQEAKDLPYASSLCGSCSEICPVKIDIHHGLLWLRKKVVDEHKTPLAERVMFKLWLMTMKHPWLYRLSAKLGRWFQPLFRTPSGSLRVPQWTKTREFPQMAKRSFREMWKTLDIE